MFEKEKIKNKQCYKRIMDISLKKALNDIYFYKGIVPFDSLKVITERRVEAIPHLLQMIKKTISCCNQTGDYYVAHILSLLLLAQFREQKTYPLIIELLNLPIESIDRLYGDMFTETFPSIIASIYDGNSDPLFALVRNPKTDYILRCVIGNTFSVFLHHKMMDKEYLILKLKEILPIAQQNGDFAFFTMLADLTLESKLEPLYDIIRASFKAKMIDEDMVDLETFEEYLPKPQKELIPEKYFNFIHDAGEELSTWEGYSNEKPIIPKINRNANCPCGSGEKFKFCSLHRLA